METKNKFFCKLHGHQIIASAWQNSFVLECGCAYRFNDWRGVEFINSTSQQSVQPTGSKSAPLQALSTTEVDSIGGADATLPPSANASR